ncbi:DNA primase [Parahaliea mediterranea]|uniref:DNA primase n=1 Tax=Parahaliea mediterranea TaxID=651086 RepID=UPI00187EA3BE|nr:DNA primase [Parahaliea mediterranea]
MSAHEIVNRLEFCKPTGKGQWIARCPAHQDNGPSLSIKDAGDGRTLIHCFAGCGAVDVLAAIGLEVCDLYPPTDHYRTRRYSAPAETVDSLVIEIAEHDRAKGRRLSKADIERYRAALKRRPPKSDAIVEIAYEMGALS